MSGKKEKRQVDSTAAEIGQRVGNPWDRALRDQPTCLT